MSTTATTSRRPRWHPNLPPPQTPKILNLPRRTRRCKPRNAAAKPKVQGDFHGTYRGRLEALFDQERIFSKTVPVVLLNSGRCGSDEDGRRERVEECEDSCGGGGGRGRFFEEKWRFQAEILRAECNFLRMEREFALKKLERNRVQMERTLRSAVQTLVSGRKKMNDGESANEKLEEEIADLEEKLEELKRSSQMKDIEVKRCSNFDKKASHLQRRLEKLVGLSNDNLAKEMRQMAESSFSINMNHQIHVEDFVSSHKSNNNNFTDSVQVGLLRSKLEGVSTGMLNRMEEDYESMLSTSATSSAASSASTSKRIEFPHHSSFSTRQPHQEAELKDEKKCSGRCKAIVRRIVEQVKAETEQWSQMQEMLGQVRQEMEELQVSRDFWEDRALDSDYEIQTLRSTVKVWEDKALTFETKANELQTEVCALRDEVGSLRKAQKEEARRVKVSEPLSLGAHIAKERILVCRTKENHNPNEKVSKQDLSDDARRKACTCSGKAVAAAPRRTPFRNLENMSPKVRQNVRAIFPLQSP